MLSILMAAFLSFSSVSGSLITKNQELENNSYPISTISNEDVPQPKVQLGKYDVGWCRNNLIGRHQMISLDSVKYLGEEVIDRLSETYNSNALTNFHFTKSFSTVETSTISTSVQLSSQATTTIGVKAGMDDVSVSEGETISEAYKIENVTTFSYSQKKEQTVSYDVSPETVKGKHFYLAAVAYVYKIKCQKWQYDDYWWGDYEVTDSRSTFSTYITLNPFITIAFDDGTFVK